MIIDFDDNKEQITVDKNNVVVNSSKSFFHYKKNNNGDFGLIYNKNNIGARSYNNNKIWILLNTDKDIIYSTVSNVELELDSIIDVYKINNNTKKDSYLCVVAETVNKENIIDTLGIVINPSNLEPLFVYSVNNNITKPVINVLEAKKIFGYPVSVNYRLKYTIEEIIEKELDNIKSSKERCEILEKVIKKQSDRV